MCFVFCEIMSKPLTVKLRRSGEEWEEAKGKFQKELQTINESIVRSDAKNVVLSTCTHDEFAAHLLDVHHQWCRACNTALGRRVTMVTTATQTDCDPAIPR